MWQVLSINDLDYLLDLEFTNLVFDFSDGSIIDVKYRDINIDILYLYLTK